MKKTFYVLGLFVLVSLSLTVLAEDRPKSIGLILPLTGPLADWGEAMRLGAELAVKEADISVMLRVEDSQFVPTIGLNAYDKVTSAVDGLIVFGSSVSMAIAPRAERDKLLTISIATSDDIQRNRQYVFRHMVSADAVTNVLLPEVAKRDLKRIGAISTTQDGMLAFQRNFVRQAKERVVNVIDLGPSEREFSTLLKKMFTLNIDSIYSTLLPPQTSIMARQARQLGFKGQIFASTQVNSIDEIKAGGTAFEGLFFAADGDSHFVSFEKRFVQEFKKPAGNFAANAYDSVRLLLGALQQNDGVSALEGVRDFEGALGRYSVLADHSFAIPVHLRQVKQGQIEILK